MECLFAALTGACLGSFCSVLVYRIPAGQSVVWGRSQCGHCGKLLLWYELIPIVSFVMQQGRCRACESQISKAYLMREAGVAALGMVLFYTMGWSLDFVRFGILAVLLVAVSEIDYKHGIIPNQLVVVGGVLGGALMLNNLEALGMGVLASAGSFISLLIVQQGSKLAFGRVGLGMGDVKLVAVVALFIGWNSLWAFYLATLIGGVAGLLGIIVGRYNRSTRIPFAPFISLGVVCSAYIYPEDVLSWF